MKFQKLDQKQTPQVVALVVLVVAVFGYGGYSIISSAAPPKKKRTQTRRDEREPVRVAEAPRSMVDGAAAGTMGAPGGPAGVAGAEGAVSTGAPVPSPIPGGAPLPSVYSPDPFRSLVPQQTSKPVRVKPASSAAKAPSQNRRMALSKLFGGLPKVGDAFPGLAQGSAEVRPAAPPPPVRPEIELTGVIDAEKGGTDMALVIMDDQQRILQVGDKLPNNYRVAKIALDGVLLVCGKDRFFVGVGKKSEPAQPKTEEGAAVAPPTVRS